MSRLDPLLLERARAFIAGQVRPPGPESDTAATDDDASRAVEIAAALCRRFEGFVAHPYLCPAGVPTIGVGATHYLDGRRVSMKDQPISRETADRLLIRMIERTYMPQVMALCPGADTPGRLAALTDFAFNCGVGALKASTLRRKVNAGEWDDVPGELMKWVNGGGRRLPGLVLRRQAESALI